MTKQLILICILLTSTLQFGLKAQSIAEKKANLKTSESDLGQEEDQFLFKVNQDTTTLHVQIHDLYNQVEDLHERGAPPEQYKHLLDQINKRKNFLMSLENKWRQMASKNNRTEGYGLWHAPETSLEQLVIDYGSQDYVYLVPHDVSAIKVSVDSNLPIPRSSWTEMLELILSQNGVGIRQLNPYLRELYLIKDNNSNLKMITNKREDLELLPAKDRVSYVIAPEPSEVRKTYSFLQKFVNPNTTTLQVLGRDILVTGPAGDILGLLKLYDFIATNRGEKEYRLITVYKTPAAEMAKILETMFDQAKQEIVVETGKGAKNVNNSDIAGLKIVVLENMAQALFVVGTRDEVRKAEEVVNSVERQIGGARDKVVHWYTVRHSDPEELADVLYRVYSLMLATGAGMEGEENIQTQVNIENGPEGIPLPPPPQKEPPSQLYGEEGYYQEGGYIVNPKPIEPRSFTNKKSNEGRDNFIVDPKSSSIVMVVEADILPKLKDLLRKLDVPKKMVQIETLLFEKVLTRENSVGLNLLKVGEHIASNRNITGAVFNHISGNHHDKSPANSGVFEFMLSRRGSDSGIPAFDLAYRFLLAQDDVQINSNPSILTLNQVPATIAINEELSINTGVFEVETAKGVTLKDAFTRGQYGITISIKPTIHIRDEYSEENGMDYVTLETDITFDTVHPHGNSSRPDVTRRHIENQVSIPDGDTVILGGLRRKTTTDHRDAIPFIGEIPGFGKLFSINNQKDLSSEMYIFITPHIVKDPKEQLQCLRQELLCLRPGDVPYFLECVEEASRFERTKLMEGSMMLLFGRPHERYYVSDCCEVGEYDGR